MGQEDYLKRQLDQLGQVLSRMLSGLLGLKDKGLLNEGMEEVNQSLKNELGFTPDEFAVLPDEEFIRILEKEKGFRNAHFEKLSDLLLFVADHTSESVKKRRLYEKCLLLYKHIEQSESTYSFDRHSKMKEISQVLNNLKGNESNLF